MNWLYNILAKFKREKVAEQRATLSQRCSHLNVCLGSNLTVDSILLSSADSDLTAPIPYDLLKSLTVKDIQRQRVYDTDRWLITFEERMPETGFAIYAEMVDSISSFTLWFVVDEFVMQNEMEWRATLADHTLDITYINEIPFDSVYYVEHIPVTTIQEKTVVEVTDLDHEKVWKRAITSLSGSELFKKVIVNDARQQVAFGYEFTKAQIHVNY